MEEHYIFDSHLVVYSTNKKDYMKFYDIPKDDYEKVYMLKFISITVLNSNLFLNRIEDFVNLNFIVFNLADWSEINLLKTINNIGINKFAIFQKLCNMAIINYNNYALTTFNQHLIYQNKMILFNPQKTDFENIPECIEYLNIINTTESEYNYIPNTIKHLHITIKSYDKYKQCNLPISLESISITLPYRPIETQYNSIINNILNNTKIPFGCKYNIEYV